MRSWAAGTRGVAALRVVLLVAPVLALLATGPQLAWPNQWLVALTVALSVGFAAMPESMLGTADLAVVVVWWAVAAHDDVPVSAILAALLAYRLFKKGAPPMPDMAIEEAKRTRADLEAQKIERDQLERSTS